MEILHKPHFLNLNMGKTYDPDSQSTLHTTSISKSKPCPKQEQAMYKFITEKGNNSNTSTAHNNLNQDKRGSTTKIQ